MNLWQGSHLLSVQGLRAANSEPRVHPHALVPFPSGCFLSFFLSTRFPVRNSWVVVVLSQHVGISAWAQRYKLSFSVSRGSNGICLYSSGDTIVLGPRMAPQSQGCLTAEDLLPKDGVSTRSSAPAAPDKRWPVLTRRLPPCLSRAFLFQTVSL